MPQIIVKARIVIKKDGRYLFSRGFDSKKDQKFLRPLGGHVEFEESATDAIKREMTEEIGEEVTNLRLLKVIENFFSYEGVGGHEIIFLFEGEVANKKFYDKEKIVFKEGDRTVEASWYKKGDVEKSKLPIYPNFDYFGYK